MRRLVWAVLGTALAMPPALMPPALAQVPSTLTIALREDPDVLDPTLGSAYVSRIVYAAMCDKLFDIDEHLAIVPQLATGWAYEDPLHLVLTLRAGVRFQDGTPFDAEAVRYSLNRHQTLKGSMRAGEVNAIAAMEVIDPLHLRLVLKAPSTPLLSMLADRAGIVVSPRAAEAAGAAFGAHPVCVGAYAFEGRVAQDSITLVRSRDYWDDAQSHFDRIVYRPMTNPAVRLANLQAGTVDLVEQVLPSDADAVRANPRLRLAAGEGIAYSGINFNVANGAAADFPAGRSALVRQAFEASLDRAALIQVVYDGLYVATAQANPPSSPFYLRELGVPPRDLVRARALLAQAGVALPVPITLTVTNAPDQQQVGEVIQAMAGEAGFAVTLRATEFASALQAGYGGRFEAFLINWSGRVDPDGNTWQLLHTGGTFNYGHWSNAEADALLDQARVAGDLEARRALYARFWAIERAEMPLVYLWTPRNIVGLKRGLEGFVQVPDGLIRVRGMRMGGESAGQRP